MTDHDGDDSYRRVLTSTIVTGGATITVAVISLFRSKLLALMVGPAGIGAMGILNSAMTLLASIACLGLTFSGVRQIAVTSGAAQRRVRWLIWAICLAGGLLAATVVLVADRHLLDRIAGMDALDGAQWWVAAGLIAMVVAAVQMTVLQGLRQIRRLAELRIVGAMIGAIAGVSAVWKFGDAAIPFAVIAVPLGNIVAGLIRPPTPEPVENRATLPPDVVQTLLALGLVTLVTGTATSLWQLAVRSIVVDHLSLEAAGLYQAAFALSAMNVAIVLAALGADYFPRLSQASDDGESTRKIVSEQYHAAMTLAAPLLLALMASAPIALQLLYSSQFTSAWPLLQLQVLGDLIRIPGWVLAFVLVANGRSGAYLALEVGFSVTIALASLALIPRLGLGGAGAAYVLSYSLYFVTAFILARKSGIRIADVHPCKTSFPTVAAVAIVALSMIDTRIGAAAGLVTAGVFAFYALRTLRPLVLERLQK